MADTDVCGMERLTRSANHTLERVAMRTEQSIPGIYLNTRTRKALRAATRFAAPSGEDWVLLDEDTMIGMVRVRELAAERGLVDDPQQIQWTGRADDE
jgi:hypothetical protein